LQGTKPDPGPDPMELNDDVDEDAGDQEQGG
jgi:hypothetical protein